MEWEEELVEGEAYLAAERWQEAYRVAERLNRNLYVWPSGRMFRFMFKAACMVRATAHADALAKKLRLMPGDENKFVAASWFHSLAAEAFADGRPKDAIAQLEECLAIAPNHRETFLSDPRIAGLLAAFEQHERESDPSKIKPPPPLPDAGPMPALAKKAFKKARDLFQRKKYDEAWEAIGRLRVNDFHRKEPLRLAFDIARNNNSPEVAVGLAQLLQRGGSDDRKFIAEFYRSQAVAGLEIGREDAAKLALQHAMEGMKDFRPYFEEDYRLKKLLEKI